MFSSNTQCQDKFNYYSNKHYYVIVGIRQAGYLFSSITHTNKLYNTFQLRNAYNTRF